MEVQDTKALDTYVQGRLRRNNNARLSALYRHCRQDGRVSRIGCYVLLSYLAEQIRSLTGRKVSRSEILTAMNYSQEFMHINKKEKTELLNQLTRYELRQRT